MVRCITLILFVFILKSCSYKNASSIYINNFTYCYKNQPTGLDTLLQLNGFYTSMEIKPIILYHKNNQEVIDTSYYNDMFFKNGICLRNFGATKNGVSISNNKISNFFDSINNGKLTNYEKMIFYNGYFWGSYKIVNDTIKAQYIYKPIHYSVNDSWRGHEIWYKILNSKYIKEINLIPLDGFKSKADSIWFYNMYSTGVNKKAPYNFIPTNTIPSPDSSWIVKEPWFWCK